MSEGYFGKREKLYLSDLHRGLIVANHILHHHRVFDTCGHISVRNPDNPTASFWLPQDLPPALLSSAIQLIEYNIDDGEQTEKDERRKPPIERFMHSEIYKKFPDVNCVVSGHCLEVISYTWGGVPLRSMNNKCAFLGKCSNAKQLKRVKSQQTAKDQQSQYGIILRLLLHVTFLSAIQSSVTSWQPPSSLQPAQAS